MSHPDPTESASHYRAHLRVVCAVIQDEQGLFLVAQRPLNKSFPGLWEFPGGKIEPGESPESALQREIMGELGVHIRILDSLPSTWTKTEHDLLELIPLRARIVEGEPQNLEHLQLQWILPTEFHTLNWAPADVPILKSLGF